jgi:hypothetical protein
MFCGFSHPRGVNRFIFKGLDVLLAVYLFGYIIFFVFNILVSLKICVFSNLSVKIVQWCCLVF